ncbi:GNAT family N-acetyltransferase [Paenibacillus guangzhouensis]|uniref:GNAT family N-acetyltransferase n=1 Tax=Paenibacillus guangzhouensis TaxID=1473112 RepID=UPI0012674CB2|nr:GNAT family N-acetyltransferase [Paenibacillus guangzhouensis]
MLEISAIPYEDKTLLHQLIQFYRYDSSEFDGHALTSHGLYLYKYLDHQWTDNYRRPLIFRVDRELAGFALVALGVPKEFVKLSEAELTNTINDFFIMRKFRGQGYGRQAACAIFDQFPGAWEVRQTAANIPANRFWNRVIGDYTNGVYIEKVLQEDIWHGPVQIFASKT